MIPPNRKMSNEQLTTEFPVITKEMIYDKLYDSWQESQTPLEIVIPNHDNRDNHHFQQKKQKRQNQTSIDIVIPYHNDYYMYIHCYYLDESEPHYGIRLYKHIIVYDKEKYDVSLKIQLVAMFMKKGDEDGPNIESIEKLNSHIQELFEIKDEIKDIIKDNFWENPTLF